MRNSTRNKFVSLVITIVMISQVTFAAGKTLRGATPAATTRGTSGTDGALPVSGAYATPTIKSGADDAAKDQSGGAGANAAIGMALSAAAMALMMMEQTRPAGMALMMMAGMAMQQSGETAKKSASNTGTSNKVSYNPSSGDSGLTGVDPADPFGNPQSLTRTATYKTAISNFKKAEALGMKYDPKTNTMSLPNGKQVALSESGMANAGLGSAALAAAKKEADKLSEKILSDMNKSLIGTMDADGSGSGSSASGNASSYEEEPMPGFAAPEPTESLADRSAASVAGMTKNFNGEPIGVAGDSLFDMVNRRYQRKEKQDFFIPDLTAQTK